MIIVRSLFLNSSVKMFSVNSKTTTEPSFSNSFGLKTFSKSFVFVRD